MDSSSIEKTTAIKKQQQKQNKTKKTKTKKTKKKNKKTIGADGRHIPKTLTT